MAIAQSAASYLLAYGVYVQSGIGLFARLTMVLIHNFG